MPLLQGFEALGSQQGPASINPLRDAPAQIQSELRGLSQALAAALLEVRLARRMGACHVGWPGASGGHCAGMKGVLGWARSSCRSICVWP